MAVVSVNEIHDERDTTFDESSGRDYTREWRVRTDSPLDGPLVVRQGAGLPRLGDFYTDGRGNLDLYSRCRSVRARHDQGDPQTWTVTATYSSRATDRSTSGGANTSPDGSSTAGQDPSNRTENPLDRPAEISFDFETYREIITQGYRTLEGETYGPEAIEDTKLSPILNSAMEPFDPPPEEDRFRPVLKITKNVPFFNFALSVEITGCTNEDFFFGAAPGFARLRKYAGKTAYENGIGYFVREVEVEFDLRGFSTKLLDAGYNYLLPADGNGKRKRAEILLNGGHRPSHPVPLDGDGNELYPDTGVAVDGQSSLIQPVYLSWRTKPKTSFAALGLL